MVVQWENEYILLSVLALVQSPAVVEYLKGFAFA